MPATALFLLFVGFFFSPGKATVGFENFPEIFSLDTSNNEDRGSGIGFYLHFLSVLKITLFFKVCCYIESKEK